MAAFLIIGEEPSTVPKIVHILKLSSKFSVLRTKTRKIAIKLGVVKSNDELQQFDDLNLDNLEDFLSNMLFFWKEQCGNDATLEALCLALSCCGLKHVADKLENEFTRLLKNHILPADGDFLSGNLLKLSEVFTMPPAFVSSPKKNDPSFVIGHLPMANISRDCIGRMMELSVRQLNAYQLKVLLGYSINKLSLNFLSTFFSTDCYNHDEDNGRQVIETMNLSNYGKSYLLWYIAARSILEAMKDDAWRMQDNKKEVFLSGRDYPYKFKHELLMYFIDWLVGMKGEEVYECYTLKKIFYQYWFRHFCIACVKSKAVNLIEDFNTRPLLLHRLVGTSVNLDQYQLEVIMQLVKNKINVDPKSVDSRNEFDMPPLLSYNIHVKLIKILAVNPCANLHVINHDGRNFFHLASIFLPELEFEELVRFLIKHGLTEHLNARDLVQRTPLLLRLREYHFDIDLDTINLFSSFGFDLNVSDKYGQTSLHYAVSGCRSDDVLEALIAHGSDFNCRDINGATLLHHAAGEGHLDAVKFFIKLGLDVNARDNNLNTPLHYAACGQSNIQEFNIFSSHVTVINFLLQQDADINAINTEGLNPLQVAKIYNKHNAVNFLSRKMDIPLTTNF